MIKKLLLALFLASPCFADQVGVASFKYLNSNENSTIIAQEEAQDLLNVDITPGGKSVKKRPGYGVYKSLATDLGMHGGYHFFDTTGNDVQLWGSSTTLKSIVSDGVPVVLVTSATSASTWDCTDSQGSAYCANSSRDGIFKTNGTTLQNWHNSPLGTMVDMTPERLVVAGVSGSPNTLYHSQANTFLNFVTGPLSTDPFTEVIASPGSKITHIRWACGKVLWWKDQSFGYEDFDDQYSLSIKIISDTIGTFDNTSAMDPGGAVWFRGQDGHIWRYDCSALTKESIEITPQIQSSGRRVSNSYTESSQADFQLGSSSGTNSLSTRISVGDVVVASFTATDVAAADFAAGSFSNAQVSGNAVLISTADGDVPNNSFETGSVTNWTLSGSSVTQSTGWDAGGNCTATPRTGSKIIRWEGVGCAELTATAELRTCVAGTVLTSVAIPWTANDCAWDPIVLSGVGAARKRVKVRFTGAACNGQYVESDCFTASGSNITFYTVSAFRTFPLNRPVLGLDDVTGGSDTVTSGVFTSKTFNTGVPYSFVFASATWTTNTVAPSFVLQKSANGSTGWLQISNSTGVNVSNNAQFLRYISTFTADGTGDALSTLQGVNILARSSGTYFSPVKAAPNMSSWSTFNPNWVDNGDDILFYIRASTSPFYVQNSSPPWVLQTAGSLVAGTTGSYLQFSASFTVTAATNTASILQDETINWFDGSATDQAYMMYFDNAIWASVAYGTGVSSNTYVFRRDLINDGWGLYNFGAGGMLVQNNHLFFGDVSTNSVVYQFGSGTSDAGRVINAYWKSKDFTHTDPFIEMNLLNIDSYAKQNSGQSLTATYTINTSTSTSYSINLSSTTQTIVQHRKLLPSGKNGYNFNLKFGDTTSSSAWEIFGFRVNYTAQPYRPSN